MRSIVLILTTLGFVVGLLPMGAHLVELALAPDIASPEIYYGTYTPLSGVTMNSDYVNALDLSFEVRSRTWLWLWLAPFAGSAIGAVLAVVLYCNGFRITRMRDAD